MAAGSRGSECARRLVCWAGYASDEHTSEVAQPLGAIEKCLASTVRLWLAGMVRLRTGADFHPKMQRVACWLVILGTVLETVLRQVSPGGTRLVTPGLLQ